LISNLPEFFSIVGDLIARLFFDFRPNFLQRQRPRQGDGRTGLQLFGPAVGKMLANPRQPLTNLQGGIFGRRQQLDHFWPEANERFLGGISRIGLRGIKLFQQPLDFAGQVVGRRSLDLSNQTCRDNESGEHLDAGN
jgi:hypothetical protein